MEGCNLFHQLSSYTEHLSEDVVDAAASAYTFVKYTLTRTFRLSEMGLELESQPELEHQSSTEGQVESAGFSSSVVDGTVARSVQSYGEAATSLISADDHDMEVITERCTEHLQFVSDFGEGEGSFDGNLVLINISPANPTCQEVQTSLQEHSKQLGADIVRYDSSGRVLLSFSSVDSMLAFCSGFNDKSLPVNSISTAVLAERVLPMFLHVSVASKSYPTLSEAAHDITSYFGGNMFIHVAEVAEMASESDDGLPRHIIVMGLPMGSKQTPKIHQKLNQCLSKKGWGKIERSVHQLENTQLYRHELLPAIGFGVTIVSSSQPSIQYVLNVSSAGKFEETKDFYEKIIQHKGVCTTNGQAQRCIFPLTSRYSDFVIHYDTVRVTPPSKMASVSLQLKNLPVKGEVSRNGWLTVTDPDGNLVNMTVPISK